MNKLIDKAKKIKIIFFDIDDTLRVKDTGYMPESIKEVFIRLKEKGILTGIATGRNFYGVVPEVKALSPGFFVTINGAYVEDDKGQPIYKNPLPKALVGNIIQWLEAEKSDYTFVASHDLRISHWDNVADGAISPVYGQLKEDKSYYQSHDVYQMLTISEHNDSLLLPESLNNQVRLIQWHPNSSDIVPVTGSKAEGCKKILEQLNLSPEQMMNFGDELNDLELFDLAGLSVAMKVSAPEILEKADYITDSVENDGILKALEALEII